MQPYFIPYIGYFHLLKSVDILVLYDDVQYTKKGWINRNYLLLNEKKEYITLPLVNDSDFLKISERSLSPTWNIFNKKYMGKIQTSYKKRKNFDKGIELCKKIFNYEDTNLFNFIYYSIQKICLEMRIETKIIVSSKLGNFSIFKGKEKVIQICKALNAKKYVNTIGGSALYDKNYFEYHGVDIKFIKSNLAQYEQSSNNFVSGLSIIDLIFSINKENEIQEQLNNYEFI